MFLVVFWGGGGGPVRVGKEELGEASSELLELFLNKVRFEDTCAFVPIIRRRGDPRTGKPWFSCFIELPSLKLQSRYVKITFIF